jgi:hypothetical protein
VLFSRGKWKCQAGFRARLAKFLTSSDMLQVMGPCAPLEGQLACEALVVVNIHAMLGFTCNLRLYLSLSFTCNWRSWNSLDV